MYADSEFDGDTIEFASFAILFATNYAEATESSEALSARNITHIIVVS
jgi:hypothetical protein